MHCIGIAGVGVAAIAELLLDAGVAVSGSNISDSDVLARLAKKGARVFVGHNERFVGDADLCVYSSAIDQSNVELRYCTAKAIPIVRRGAMLAHIMQPFAPLAVAGTHGKTTTSALLTHLLVSQQAPLSYAVGGQMAGQESFASYDPQSKYFVAELDESDGSFLQVSAHKLIITNIDRDHLSYYGNSFEKLTDAFLEFIEKMRDDGLAIVNIDNAVLRQLVNKTDRNVITFGFASDADYQIKSQQQSGMLTQFSLAGPDGMLGPFELPMLGEHNILNATAAIVMAHSVSLTNAQLVDALKQFPGVMRRMMSHGETYIGQSKVRVFDDYGHHPNAMHAAFSSLKIAMPQSRVVCVFQPHRYTRTRECFDEFVTILQIPDVVILLDVYAASEEPIEGADADALFAALSSNHQYCYRATQESVFEVLETLVELNDIVLFQGAGSVVQLAKQAVSLS